MKIKLLLLCSFVLFCGYSQIGVNANWEKKQLSQADLSSISVLSESYGYIRFFYPNPHTVDFDWIAFLMYAVPRVKEAKENTELKDILLELFQPLCAQVSFTATPLTADKLLPPYFAIEHKAIGSMAELVYGRDYSPIIEIAECLSYQDVYSFMLKENLFINFPIAVKELPIRTRELARLERTVGKIDTGDVGLLSTLLFHVFNKRRNENADVIFARWAYRVTDIIMRRNYIHHFYPYFVEDRLVEKWDVECMKAIKKVAEIDNLHNYYTLVRQLHSNVNDSHANIWPSIRVGQRIGTYVRFFYPNLSFDFAGNICFVNFVGEEYANQINIGDVLLSVNNVPIEDVVQQKLSKLPHSTTSNGLAILSNRGRLLASAVQDSIFDIVLKSADNIVRTVKLKANMPNHVSLPRTAYFFKVEEGNVAYINLTLATSTYENFINEIDRIQDSKGVIFDLRGHPHPDALSIISHFIAEKIELGNLLRPFYRFPNRQNVEYNIAEKWRVLPAVSPVSREASRIYEYQEPLPIQIDKPIVFLINGKTMSFGESFAEMMQFYEVGTLLGTHTAGCNGDATRFNSLRSFSFGMTYFKFLNRDNSQFHGIGILPDIVSEMKISDIQQGIDTQLEKAKILLQ